jgi:hypothetical protein
MYANLFMNILNESFPSQVRAIGVASIATIARFSVILVPYVPAFLRWISMP